MSQVAVLMSTYNGEQYLPEQLDSIGAQRGARASVYVRDDGSADSTLQLLEQRRASGELQFEAGKNVGPARSFMNLVCSVPDHKYYAFADQDDIWLPDKLERALATFDDPEVPQLYMSNATNTDAEGQREGNLLNTAADPGLGNALVQSFSIGATMVFNHAARKLMADRGIPMHLTMHDWWAYLLVASFGKVVYDPRPSMLYRQHGQNVYGSVGHLEYLRRHWRAIGRSEKMLQGRDQASDLLCMYGPDLDDATRSQLRQFTAGRLRLAALVAALRLPVYKQKAAGTLVARLQWAACSW